MGIRGEKKMRPGEHNGASPLGFHTRISKLTDRQTDESEDSPDFTDTVKLFEMDRGREIETPRFYIGKTSLHWAKGQVGE